MSAIAVFSVIRALFCGTGRDNQDLALEGFGNCSSAPCRVRSDGINLWQAIITLGPSAADVFHELLALRSSRSVSVAAGEFLCVFAHAIILPPLRVSVGLDNL